MTNFWSKSSAGAPGAGLTADAVRARTFRKPPLGRRGYANDEVDAFLDRVAAAFDGSATIRPDEVRNVRFPKSPFGQRGYDEQDVDTLLDEVEAECARRGW